jgi:transcriptional regulator with XRE-family HTH domain
MQFKTLSQRLARNLKATRKSQGLTQEQAADRAGSLSLRRWQSVEAGTANASLKTLARLAKALDVDPADLLKKDR